MEKHNPRILSNVEVTFIGKMVKVLDTCDEIEVELDNGLHQRVLVPKEFVAYDHSEILSETNRVKI